MRNGARVWSRGWVPWVFGFAVCTIIGLSGAATYYFSSLRNNRPISWPSALMDVLPPWYAIASGFPLVLWLGRRFRIERPFWQRSLLVHLGASLFFAVAEYGLALLITWPMCEESNFLTHAVNEIQFDFLPALRINIVIYWVILAFGHALDYYAEFQSERQEAAQLEAQLAHAQLQALKMQLHPHFLFNTLHSLSALLHEDVEAADRMVSGLGNFLRLTLQNSAVQEVTLKQELEFLRCYLEIEQIRFQDRLTVRMDIDPQTLDAQVPNLLWQPIVENAIKHGIAQQLIPGSIEIGAHRHRDVLRLYVKDNGPGLPLEDSPERPFQRGLGLSNTRARLQQLYGSHYRFDLTPAPEGGLAVSLEIPFKTAPTVKMECMS